MLNPALPGGYPPHLALTREPDLTEPIFPTGYAPEGAPEYKDWLRRTSKRAMGSRWAHPRAAPACSTDDKFRVALRRPPTLPIA